MRRGVYVHGLPVQRYVLVVLRTRGYILVIPSPGALRRVISGFLSILHSGDIVLFMRGLKRVTVTATFEGRVVDIVTARFESRVVPERGYVIRRLFLLVQIVHISVRT